MGLKTFWAQISGQRIQEIPLDARFNSITSISKTNTVVYEKELDDLSSKLHRPTITASRPRKGSLSRKRKSWLGSRPVHDDFIPAVPNLDQRYLKEPRAAFTKDSYSGLGVLPEPSADDDKRKSRRISLSRKVSLRAIRNNYKSIDALPPMPTLPTNMNQTITSPAHNAEQRKSRAMSFGRKSIDDTATKSNKQRKRRSLWSSSNPDDSEDESVPPVPALVRDGSQSPPSRPSSEYRRKDSRHDETTPECKSSGHRRTYTPRNAVAGFLMSTSGASDATRKSFRKSFHIAETDDLVCLTDEQRREWEKLKSLTNTFGQDIERYDNSGSENGPKYANKQALAALEFGLH